MLAVALAALTGGTDTVAHLMQTVLPRYAAITSMPLLSILNSHSNCNRMYLKKRGRPAYTPQNIQPAKV